MPSAPTALLADNIQPVPQMITDGSERSPISKVRAGERRINRMPVREAVRRLVGENDLEVGAENATTKFC